VNLIPRLYDVFSGSVRIDGVDVREYDMDTLRQSIGIVPQNAVLFKGSIRQNLLWGNKFASDEELWAALETAQAREVVKGKEGELDAAVEQGGVNFSGGQRQRLTIARALVRKPAILILDDSASALDYATDAKLRMAIRKMENPPTTFIVSQRAASVRYADQILVLDDGQLVGKGTHEQHLLSDIQAIAVCNPDVNDTCNHQRHEQLKARLQELKGGCHDALRAVASLFSLFFHIRLLPFLFQTKKYCKVS
jgi:ABC-type multidrug transport system fused ATPase/permease subunit